MRGLLGKLLCALKRKHVRGKFLRAEDCGKTKIFACPRCGRETQYKAKAAA